MKASAHRLNVAGKPPYGLLKHEINVWLDRFTEVAVERSLATYPVPSRPVAESRSAPIWTIIIVAALSPRLCHAWRVPR